MVNRIFKYHEVTPADPSSLCLIWCYLQEALTMCHKPPATGKRGNDYTLTFNAAVTSRVPCKAEVGCQVLAVDQMARVINNEPGLQPSTREAVLERSDCLSPNLKLVRLPESPWRLANAEMWWTMLHTA